MQGLKVRCCGDGWRARVGDQWHQGWWSGGHRWAGSALGIYAVHGDGRLEMVCVQVKGVVCVGVPIRVELVAEKSGCLWRCIQVKVLIVIAHVNARGQRIVVARRVLAVFLRAHGAVTCV